MTSQATKVTLEKTARPNYEGGGTAYSVFTYFVRNGASLKVNNERSGKYADMVRYAQSHAKKLSVPCEVCQS